MNTQLCVGALHAWLKILLSRIESSLGQFFFFFFRRYEFVVSLCFFFFFFFFPACGERVSVMMVRKGEGQMR